MKEKINECISRFDETEKTLVDELLLILKDMKISETKQLEALLYLSVIKNKLTISEVEEMYGKQARETVDIFNKLININYSMQETEAENIRRMFFAITKDIGIIMIKIALAVSRLRHLSDNDEVNQKLASAIFTLFAPLAARLGMSTYKTELENGAFLIQNPTLYNEIQTTVDKRFNKRQPIVERLTQLVKKCMDELGIHGRVYGRKKHIYSIYKKMQEHSMDKIYDLIAVRALVKSVADCYALLGRIHSIVVPLENRFKDYISTPKPNGYQSLHTTVEFEGFPVEIQIRTEEMHQYAEYGVAAHWLYKEKKTKQDTLDVRLAWLRQMMEDSDSSIEELSSSLGQDIYNNEIFVQTPKGKVIYLPNGSTPIDFAYSIHSEIGNKCVGAKVNNKMVPTTSELKNGDVVEIITSPNSKGPSRDWLKICKTNEARNKINSFFKKNMKDETIALGKTMLEGAIKEKGFSVSKLMSNLHEVFKQYNTQSEEELLANIGTGGTNPKVVANKLATIYQKQIKSTIETPEIHSTISLAKPTEKQISLKGLNNILIKFANCCHPMYGDDIVGFISAGRGIIIHRSICPNISYFRESRLIEAFWKEQIPVEKNKKKNKPLTNQNK